jgi:UDP-3-O-[3-hydroxymyristoyl] glucosamine N-acyltransferase
MKGTFIEAKGVYRVENADGTFNTYTPEQYRDLQGTAVEDVVDESVVTDESTIGDESVVTDESTIGDEPVVTDESTTGDEPVVTDESTTGDEPVVDAVETNEEK